MYCIVHGKRQSKEQVSTGKAQFGTDLVQVGHSSGTGWHRQSTENSQFYLNNMKQTEWGPTDCATSCPGLGEDELRYEKVVGTVIYRLRTVKTGCETMYLGILFSPYPVHLIY